MMKLSHKGANGFWVAASEEVEKYLGYSVGYFGDGYIAGRWTGAATQLGVFPTLAAAIAAESKVADRTVESGNPSNATERHFSNLQNDD